MKNISIDISNATIAEIAELVDEITKDIIDSQGKDLEDSLKKEKWHRKIKEKFTFYKDNQKVILKDIYDTNILLQIVAILSKKIYEENHITAMKFADCLIEHKQKISSLENTTQKIIDQLNALVYVQHSNYDVSVLPKNEKIILNSALNSIFVKISHISGKTQQMIDFHSAIRIYLGNDCETEDLIIDADRELSNVSKPKIFYYCLLVAISYFDAELKTESLNCFSELLQELELGDQSKREIKENILKTISALGQEHFINRYKKEEYIFDEFLDDEFFEFDSEDAYDEILETENYEESVVYDIDTKINTDEFVYFSEPITDVNELEEQTLSGIMHIKEGEEKVFRGFNLHLQNTINCDGNLIFDSCVINFNETDAISAINVSCSGRVEFVNCILCEHRNKKQYFITVNESDTEKESILLKNCSFNDCNYFVSCGKRNIEIYNCKIVKGVQFFIENASNCIVDSCLFSFPDENDQWGFFDRFTIGGNAFLTNCEINGYYNLEENKDNYNLHYLFRNIKSIKHCFVSNVIYFAEDAFDDTIVSESYFINCKDIGLAGSIDNCKFEKCEHIHNSTHVCSAHIKNCTNTMFSLCSQFYIHLFDNCYFEGCHHVSAFDKGALSYCIDCYAFELNQIENSVFLRCRSMGSTTKISDSFFDGCFGNLFNNVSRGYIKNSVFISCMTGNDYAIVTLEGDPFNNKISFQCSNIIFYKCKVSQKSSYIIGVQSGKLKEKNVDVTLDKCQFLNCSAVGKDSNILENTVTLIKNNIFSKKTKYETIRVINENNCVGLDKVNKFDDKIQPPEIPLIPKFVFAGGVSESTLLLFADMKKCNNYPFD